MYWKVPTLTCMSRLSWKGGTDMNEPSLFLRIVEQLSLSVGVAKV